MVSLMNERLANFLWILERPLYTLSCAAHESVTATNARRPFATRMTVGHGGPARPGSARARER